MEQWFNWHQGYRIIKHGDGSEERELLQGEALSGVDVGHLPRTWDELRERPPTVEFQTPNINNGHGITDALETTSSAQRPDDIVVPPEDRLFDDEPDHGSSSQRAIGFPPSSNFSNTFRRTTSTLNRRSPRPALSHEHSDINLNNSSAMDPPRSNHEDAESPQSPPFAGPHANLQGQLTIQAELHQVHQVVQRLHNHLSTQLQLDLANEDQARSDRISEILHGTSPTSIDIRNLLSGALGLNDLPPIPARSEEPTTRAPGTFSAAPSPSPTTTNQGNEPPSLIDERTVSTLGLHHPVLAPTRSAATSMVDQRPLSVDFNSVLTPGRSEMAFSTGHPHLSYDLNPADSPRPVVRTEPLSTTSPSSSSTTPRARNLVAFTGSERLPSRTHHAGSETRDDGNSAPGFSISEVTGLIREPLPFIHPGWPSNNTMLESIGNAPSPPSSSGSPRLESSSSPAAPAFSSTGVTNDDLLASTRDTPTSTISHGILPTSLRSDEAVPASAENNSPLTSDNAISSTDLDSNGTTLASARIRRSSLSGSGSLGSNFPNNFSSTLASLGDRLSSTAQPSISGERDVNRDGRAVYAESVARENYETIRQIRNILQAINSQINGSASTLDRMRASARATSLVDLSSQGPSTRIQLDSLRSRVESNQRLYHTSRDAVLASASRLREIELEQQPSATLPSLEYPALARRVNFRPLVAPSASANDAIRNRHTDINAQILAAPEVDRQRMVIQVQLDTFRQASRQLLDAHRGVRRATNNPAERAEHVAAELRLRGDLTAVDRQARESLESSNTITWNMGTREEVERLGDDYVSPVGELFERAYERYRAAEEDRNNPTASTSSQGNSGLVGRLRSAREQSRRAALGYTTGLREETTDAEDYAVDRTPRSLDSTDDDPPEALTDEQMTKNMRCQICYVQLAAVACIPCGKAPQFCTPVLTFSLGLAGSHGAIEAMHANVGLQVTA